MTQAVFSALFFFAFVSSITPGPNNLMLMASGANFGFRRTLPHMLGVGLGFTFMILMIGLGIAQIFEIYPASKTVLKIVSVAYLLYLAWKIATAAPLEKTSDKSSPFSFLQACLFQWVNPKAWSMALSSIGAYAPSQDLNGILWVALLFGAVNLPCISIWVIFGQQMKRLLTSQKRLRAFNITMALLLVASLYPVLFT